MAMATGYYCTGKILSVLMKNFKTYTESLIKLNEFLNIIVGETDIGNSTIAAALFLGMGGSCKLFGISTEIGDFIKNNDKSAEIEIQIYKNENREVMVFNRYFTKTQNVFTIDGKRVNQKKYRAIIKKFNILVDNIRLYIPTENVQDFLTLNAFNAQQFLASTQNSVSSLQIKEWFDKLAFLRNSQKNSVKDGQDAETKLKDLETRTKPHLDSLKARDALVTILNSCQAKILWMEYLTVLNEYKEVERDYDQAIITLTYNEEQLKSMEEERKSFETQKDTHSENRDTYLKELSVSGEKFVQLEDTLKTERLIIRDKIRSAQEHLIEMEKCESVLQALKQDITNIEESCGDDEFMLEMIKTVKSDHDYQKVRLETCLMSRDQINEKLMEREKLTNLVEETDKLKNERLEIESEIDQIKTLLDTSRDQIKRKVRDRIELKQCQDKYIQQQAILERIRSSNINIDEEKQKFKCKAVSIVKDMSKLEDEPALSSRFIKAIIQLAMEIEHMEDKINQARQMVNDIKIELKWKEDQCTAKKTSALKISDGIEPTDRRFKYKQKFTELPDSIEELEEMVTEIQGRINGLDLIDFDVDDFIQKIRQIEQLRATILNFSVTFEHVEKKMDILHNLWYPEVEKMINRMNIDLGYFMRNTKYVEVIEFTKTDIRDYPNYGIAIFVRYRKPESLPTLDHLGCIESRVASDIFLLSLNLLLQVERQWVDEINQRMDSRFEFIVFKMLINETTCKPLFTFVTPKPQPYFDTHR